MMKDKYQKQKLLQYFLSKGWYPQLEVDVIYNGRTASKQKMITDIDVFAMAANSSGILSPIIGDCKTLKNQSPINRVFWIKGLMDFFHSDFGVILLSKNIEGEHQLLASELGVSLLSDENFKIYSIATSSQSYEADSALMNTDCWDEYFSLPNRFPNLQPLYEFCRFGYWNEESFNVKLRHTVAKLRSVRYELNPDNNLNVFIFLELCSLFSISLNELTIKIFNKFLWPKDKDQLDQELKVLLWGGYENYSYFNELRNRLTNTQRGSSDLSLPEWEVFVQLVRSCLEKPLATVNTPIILKELGFQFLLNQISFDNGTNYLAYLLKKDPNASRNAIMIIDYLVKCAKLPSEFSTIPNNILMKLQR